MITVGELIDFLKEHNKETPVFMSSDAEGNEIKELAGWGLSHYVADYDCPWAIDLVHPDDVGEEYDEDDLDGAIVLWPVN